MLKKEYRTVTPLIVHPSTPNQISQEQTPIKILKELSPPPNYQTQGDQRFVFHPEEERKSQKYED
jgi:hypothetical protein